MKFLYLTLFAAFFSLPAHADYATFPDVFYGTDSKQDMDIYQPVSLTPLPLIVMIHGGAWVSGDKNNLATLVPFWANNGYVVANVNYRLASTAGNQYPTDINDVTASIAYLIAHASTYNIDTTKIVVFGTSAGGYLALEEGQVNSANVKACVVFYGPNLLAGSTFLNDTYEGTSNADLVDIYLGATLSADPTVYYDASPIAFVTSAFPPTILFHGEADTTIPPKQSITLHKYLKELGVTTRLVLVPNAGHGFLTQPSTDSDTYQQQALDFLNKVNL